MNSCQKTRQPVAAGEQVRKNVPVQWAELRRKEVGEVQALMEGMFQRKELDSGKEEAEVCSEGEGDS